jgi:hypothetical protein
VLVALTAVAGSTAIAMARENPDPRIRRNEEFTGYINNEKGEAIINTFDCFGNQAKAGANGTQTTVNVTLNIKIRREDGPGNGIDDGNGYTGRGAESSDKRVPVIVRTEDGDKLLTVRRYAPVVPVKTDLPCEPFGNGTNSETTRVDFIPKPGRRGNKWQPDSVDVTVVSVLD